VTGEHTRDTDCTVDAQPMTADRLRELMWNALAEHRDIVHVRPATTIYSDRLALAVEDRAGHVWRVHVLTEPVR
jgi:uncharacterized glyoxalase superfamily protein PhnB